jgi:RING finger protein 113A
MAEFEYKADASGLKDVGERTLATRSANWDLDRDEGGAREDSSIKRARLDENGNLLPDDGLYHGAKGYTNFIKPDPNANRSSKMKAGPIKATSNIRTITVTDYQPDVCKDYKGESSFPTIHSRTQR